MSGGIDSSVAAALLKRADFSVMGVFLKLAYLPKFKESERRAKKVAKILKIPFLVLDLRKEFKKRIINYFLEGYKEGITPNPCVVCNKEIKFGLLLEKALKLGADFIATGHYARLRREIQNPKSKILNYRYKLLKARDKEKDQSYFLWKLNQKQLRKTLFPVGNYARKEVEKLARKFKLPFTNVKKSVEICFIKTPMIAEDSPHLPPRPAQPTGQGSVNDFLKKYLRPKPGPIAEQVRYGVKKIIGRHKGLYFYTIGQRKGIGLPGGPYYVLGKDLKKNFLIVTKNEKDLYKKELVVKNVNWVSGKEPKLPLKVKAKIRYRHRAASAILIKHKTWNIKQKKYKVIFDNPQRAITPGQSVVFYCARPKPARAKEGGGQELLGGGVIC